MVYLKEEYRGKTQPEDIIREAQKHLPKHEVPVFVHISDEPLPVNAKYAASVNRLDGMLLTPLAFLQRQTPEA